jgi:hypothetical protein
MYRHQRATLTLLACIPLYCCSSNSMTSNPLTAGTGAPAAGTGAAGTPAVGAAGTATTTTGTPSAGTGAAGSSTAGSSATTAGKSGSAATAGTGTAGTGGDVVTPAAGTGGATATAGTGAAGMAAPAGDQCVAGLKAMCGYAEKETACSSVMTPTVPLTAGGMWGNKEIKLGPYGGYVEWNQGAAFMNPKNPSEDTCDSVAAIFGEPASTTADVLDLRGGDLTLYTIFRPACMKDGEKYPVITWGNGTCGQSGGYSSLNVTVASYGFVVISANSRFTGDGGNEMLKALDLAKSLNEDPKSIYFGKLDLDHIGAMGHSQGGGATATAAMDPRVKSAIIWNAGTSAVKPFLTISGERDITGFTAQSMQTAVAGEAQPGAWLFYHQVLETGGNVTGHLTLMEQPERVVDPAVAWWKYQLLGDAEAKKMFVGDSCGLCNSKDQYEYGHNAKLQ